MRTNKNTPQDAFSEDSIVKIVSVVALVLALLPAVSQAQFGRGLRELTLSGSGTSSREVDAGTVSATGELGWYYSPRLELGVRQSFSWSKGTPDSESVWNGATRLYSDYHYGSGQWRPYLGASAGFAYGDQVETTLFAGPEAGLKFYVQPAAFLFIQMEYQFRFKDTGEMSSNVDDGAYAYSFGAGYNF
jgi:hypothetical protein